MKGKDSDYSALNGELIMMDDEQIKLIIANKFQKVAIENLKQDLLAYLRTELKNNFIKLDLEIRKIEEKELRYTSREKFEYLAEKYPKLRDLQSRLDLDPDF
jgi:DNA polymerase-3 subunit gamma/tau